MSTEAALVENISRPASRARFAKEACYRVILAALRSIGFGWAGPSEGVLLFKPDRIGDFVLATGAIHLFCQKYGPEQLTLMVSSIVGRLAEREFPNCRIITIPTVKDHLRGGLLSGWWKVRRANGGRRYRKLVSLRHHPTLFEDLVLSSIPAEDTVGANRTAVNQGQSLHRLRSFVARQTFAYPAGDARPEECQELEANRRLAETTLGEPVSLANVLPRLTQCGGQTGDYLLLAPFGSDSIRDYPSAQLVAALTAAGLPSAARFVLCGDASQLSALKVLAKEIASGLPQQPIEVLQPAGVPEFADLVARARCVFSMESAAAHIATALDKPGVFMLGGGHFGYFAPWTRSTRQRWLFNRMNCYGCDWQCRHSYVKCIHDIPAESVGTALRQIWSLAAE